MNSSQMAILLEQRGFEVLAANADAITISDPTCVIGNLTDFISLAWIAMDGLAVMLLTAWAIAMIWGGDVKIAENLKNLFLLFSGVALIPAAIKVLADEKYLKCGEIEISAPEINNILNSKNAAFAVENPEELIRPVRTDPGQTAAPETPAPAGSTGYASATGQGSDVIYVAADGTRIRRSGGTRAWRNNNPGNIRMSDFIRGLGAIGVAGNFAVFPDEETGYAAIAALLRSGGYINLTVGGAINRWAPPFENDTAAYQRRVEYLTGMPLATPMRSLNDGQLRRVADAIRQIEGWTAGQETRL